MKETLHLCKELFPEGKKRENLYNYQEYTIDLLTGKWVNYHTKESGLMDDLMTKLGKQQVDPLADTLTTYAQGKRNVIYRDIAKLLGDNLTFHDNQRIGKIMHNLGYRKITITINGKANHGYQHYRNPLQIKDKAA